MEIRTKWYQKEMLLLFIELPVSIIAIHKAQMTENYLYQKSDGCDFTNLICVLQTIVWWYTSKSSEQACILPTPRRGSCGNYARCVNQILQGINNMQVCCFSLMAYFVQGNVVPFNLVYYFLTVFFLSFISCGLEYHWKNLSSWMDLQM